MSDLAAFSDLVGDLYDAAFETSLFPAAMEKIKALSQRRSRGAHI